MYGGKFTFQNRLGYLAVERKFTIFALFYFVFGGKFQVQGPRGLIFGGAIYRRVFCVAILGGLYLEGLIFGILRYYETMDIAVCCFKNYNIRSTPKQRFGVTDLE